VSGNVSSGFARHNAITPAVLAADIVTEATFDTPVSPDAKGRKGP
jgi:hypothetical protein